MDSNPNSVLINGVTISCVTKSDMFCFVLFSTYKAGVAIIAPTSLGCWEGEAKFLAFERRRRNSCPEVFLPRTFCGFTKVQEILKSSLPFWDLVI